MNHRLHLLRQIRNSGLVLALASAAVGAQLSRDADNRGNWGNLFNQTPTQITNFLVKYNQRITSLQVTNVSPLRLNALAVANTGAFASAATWWYGLDYNQVTQKLISGKSRLVDLASYVVNNKILYAVSMVPSTDSRGGFFYWLQTTDANKLATEGNRVGGRPYLLTSTVLNGRRVYTCCYRRDPSSVYWEVWAGASTAFINGRMKAGGLRIVDLERVAPNNYNVVLRKWTSGTYGWWWVLGADRAYYSRFVDVNLGRAFHLQQVGTNSYDFLAVAMAPFDLRAYGRGCAGSAGTPLQTASGTARPGGAVNYRLSRVPRFSASLLHLGFDAMNFGAARLPIDLAPLGAPGCKIETSMNITFVVPANLSGVANFRLSIPNERSLIWLRFFTQYLNIDARANRLGLAASNGMATRINP